MCLEKDLYPEYLKKSYNLVIKNQYKFFNLAKHFTREGIKIRPYAHGNIISH